jgi:putative transposase
LAEEEEKTLTFYEFPQPMHRYIRTTNAIASLFSNLRQRTDQIDVFTTEMSCLTIVWATIEGISPPKNPRVSPAKRATARASATSLRGW